MTFLALNGWTVPVAKGGKGKPLEIGERARTFGGDYVLDRRAIKQTWDFKTTSLSEMVAAALRGTVVGLGEVFAFDGTLYSGKGLPFATTTGVAYGTATGAVGGHAVYDHEGRTETKFGSGSFRAQSSRTNLLSAAEAAFESGSPLPGSWLPLIVSTPALSTTYALSGAKSFAVTIDGGDGIQINKTVTADKKYVFSIYVLCTGGTGGNITLKVNGGVAADSTVTVAGSATWRRLAAHYTLAVAETTLHAEISGDEDGMVFYVDCAMLEEAPVATVAVPSPWVAGGAAGSLCAADISTALWTGAKDLTVAFWCTMHSGTFPSTLRYLLSALSSSESFALYRDNGSNVLKWGVNGTVVSATPSPAWTAWLHVALVMRSQPETGEVNRTMYLNGAAAATGADYIANIPALGALDVGHSAGSVQNFGGAIDDLVILPWAAPAAQVAAMYALGTAALSPPKLLASGDLMPGASAQVIGQITDESFVGIKDGSVWRNNAKRLSFTLEEV